MRDELRAMMGARALHRESLALEPLLAEHDALEIAAAALRMLEFERERARAKRPTKSIEQPVAIPVPNERVAPVGTSYTSSSSTSASVTAPGRATLSARSPARRG